MEPLPRATAADPTDSSGVESAIIAALLADAALTALMPDGVYFDEADENSQRFVLVSLVDAQDVAIFGQRAYEDALYLVKAVALSTSGGDVRAAALRIDAVLEDCVLTVPGYTWMGMARDRRVRMTEVDDADAAIRWYHRGGRYRVQVGRV